jgi:hypothetical protein
MTGDDHGLPTRILQYAQVRLEFLAEAAPRIVRLASADSPDNLLAEVPDFKVPIVGYIHQVIRQWPLIAHFVLACAFVGGAAGTQMHRPPGEKLAGGLLLILTILPLSVYNGFAHDAVEQR